jgi:hypothetical protein
MANPKLNTDFLCMVRLIDSASKSPILGATTSATTIRCTVVKSDGSSTIVTLSSGQFTEVAAVPFSGQGFYLVTIVATHISRVGPLWVGVRSDPFSTYSASDVYPVSTQVDELLIGDLPTLSEVEASTILAKQATVAALPTLGNIEGSTVLAKEATVSGLPSLGDIEGSTVLAKEASLSGIADDCARILDINEGRWKIDAEAKQLILYKVDGSTEIRRFNLFNDLGLPDVETVYDKIPI